MGDELQKHGCFFVSIHLAKSELVAVCSNLSGENFLVGTAVDFKQPFLLDSSDGELHAIGEALTLGLELDFYLRVFVRVYRGKKECAQSGTKIGNVYNCNSCGNYEFSSYLV